MTTLVAQAATPLDLTDDVSLALPAVPDSETAWLLVWIRTTTGEHTATITGAADGDVALDGVGQWRTFVPSTVSSVRSWYALEVAGPPGADGADGEDGADGADGATGPQGETGATGATGPAGNDGADGEDGATGATGPQGDTGPTGATGPQGDTGPTGATGATGPAGADGADADTLDLPAENIVHTGNFREVTIPDAGTLDIDLDDDTETNILATLSGDATIDLSDLPRAAAVMLDIHGDAGGNSTITWTLGDFDLHPADNTLPTDIGDGETNTVVINARHNGAAKYLRVTVLGSGIPA